MNINTERFIELYQARNGNLKPSAHDGLVFLLECIAADDNITDVRHAAYMLATARHETAKTYQPIAEYGKGTGKKYGVADKVTGKTYYGRGYVQLTWKENYQAMQQVTGIDLVNNPDMAMNAGTAYQIMSYGMRRGSFTGVKLSTYIHDDVCDYLHARKIINGMDCAEIIADMAAYIETMLRESVS